MSRRDPRLLAAAALLIAIAALIVAIIAATGGGNDHNQAPGAKATRPSADQHAADRAAIQRLTRGYQSALRPSGKADPCRFLTPLVKRAIRTETSATNVKNASCAVQARHVDSEVGGAHLGSTSVSGVTNIEFGPFTDDRKGADASAHWDTSGHQRVLFVKRDGQWLIGGG